MAETQQPSTSSGPRLNCKRTPGVMVCAAAVMITIAGWAAHAGRGIPRCRGDCNDDGDVAVNELIRGVQIALGEVTVDTCPAVDTDGDGAVQLFELIGAVHSALFGCPGTPPTPTPSSSPNSPRASAPRSTNA